MMELMDGALVHFMEFQTAFTNRVKDQIVYQLRNKELGVINHNFYLLNIENLYTYRC